MWIRRAAGRVMTILLTVILGGLLGATLARMGPGFGVDEQEFDPRLNADSIQALRQSRAEQANILAFYGRYLAGLFKGDLGLSQSLRRPVRELLSERIPVTFQSAGLGLIGGWLLGLGLAVPVAVYRVAAYDLFATFLSGFFLCFPSAVLALLLLFIGGPGPLAIAFVIFPRVFRYSRNLLRETYALPHVLTAHAKGVSRARMLLWHVAPSAAPPILALMGISVSTALAASIPIEAICSVPGIGQLAWQGALARDLPLLVNLTVLVTTVTLIANSIPDFIGSAWAPQAR